MNPDEYLTQILFTVPHQEVNWTGDKINFVFKDRFQYEGYDVEDIDMFHIQYEYVNTSTRLLWTAS